MSIILELSGMGLALSEIAPLLGLESEVVADAYYRLLQIDFIDINSSLVTKLGNDYLENHSLDNLEIGEYEILLNAFTGDIDVNVNSSIIHKDAQKYYCYKALIKPIKPSELDFKQMHKVLRTYCEKNELSVDSKLIDVVSLTSKPTRYRKVDILVYQNQLLENRIIVIENGKKNAKYEDCFYELDLNGYDLLQVSTDGFFEEKKVSKIYDLFKGSDSSCSSEFLDILSDLENPTIVLPLIEDSFFSDYLLRIIVDKLSQGQEISVFICGPKYHNNHQENILKELLKLKKRYKKLNCNHLPYHLPLMCFSKDSGCIQVLSKTELSLVSTKIGVISSFYILSHDNIEEIKRTESCLDTGVAKTGYNIVALPNMNTLEKLWLDFDALFITKFRFSIFPNGGIKDRDSFVSLQVATNKVEYNEFLNVLNKTLFESLKASARKEINDKSFFWNRFRVEYPKLQKNLDKIRVYRNNADHISLDTTNENQYYKYLNEDSGGVFIEFIPSGYEYMQSLLLNDMQTCLLEILS